MGAPNELDLADEDDGRLNRLVHIAGLLLLVVALVAAPLGGELAAAPQADSSPAHLPIHAMADVDCDGEPPAHAMEHGCQCCVFAGGAVVPGPDLSAVVRSTPSAPKIEALNDAVSAGPLFGIFRPPRDV